MMFNIFVLIDLVSIKRRLIVLFIFFFLRVELSMESIIKSG